MRLLIVEDDVPLASGLRRILEAEGHAVDVTARGEQAVLAAAQERFDLVILDIGLPQMDGFEVLRRLRSSGGDKGGPMPVLVLTARDAVEDRVHGLDLGADDYMAKPFATPELAARVRALLRRNAHDASRPLRIADLVVDPADRTATRGGRPLDLTEREYELLNLLLSHQGHLVSREMLARDVWEEPARATSLDNVIDVTMARLRRKVDGDAPAKLLHTVRGVGFILKEEEAAP